MSAAPTPPPFPIRFPFTAVVGLDDVKLALILSAIDPRLGGVLLRGEKGSAKTTLARGLAALLGDAPFIDLPIGATEDRVVGSLDLGAALTGGGHRFQPGLLAAAHGGVLYVDEVNLLPDHLVDVLLDVAASGVNIIERDGVSDSHSARFVLVGSMNPEEGEVRPQLLDRFGLAADVHTSTSTADRVLAVERRLAFDNDPAGFATGWARDEVELAEQLAAAVPATIPADVMNVASALALAVGAEGLRADLMLCRAAAALAGWDGETVTSVDHVRRVAPLVLAHRRRRDPFDAPGIDQDELDDAFDEAMSEQRDGDAGGTAAEGPPVAPGPVADAPRLTARRSDARDASGRRSVVEGTRGRVVRDREPDGPLTSVSALPTVRAAASRSAVDAGAALVIEPKDLRESVRETKAGNLLVLCVDASGSMGADERMAAAKGAVLGLLVDAYQRRDRVAMVTFRGDAADVVLRPTGSVEVAKARLADVPTGGTTPLAAGLDAALRLASTGGDLRPMVVVVSDGRATAAPDGADPWQAALASAERIRRRGVDAVVVDAESGSTRLGMARELAAAMDARHLPLADLTPAGIRGETHR